MKTKVVIFGGGEGGRKVMGRLPKDIEVIAFSDNDAKKHGTSLDGITIVKPADIPGMDYDFIIIASVHAPAILRQLEDMEIDKSRIEIGWHLLVGTPAAFPWDAVVFLLILLLAVTGSIAWLVS